METMPSQDKISMTSTKELKFSSAVAMFSDGFQQARPINLNATKEVWKIEWVGLTQAEMLTLSGIITANGAVTIYEYKPCNGQFLNKYRMEANSFSFNILGNDNFGASATFTQVFDFT
jgi:phage-related protein